MGSARRIIVVTLLILLALLLQAPDLVRPFGHPVGRWDVVISPSSVITSVGPNPARAGVRVGDLVDWSREDVTGRLMPNTTPALSDPITLHVLRDGRAISTRFLPVLIDNATMVWLREGVQFFCLALAALVLLRRPSAATWAFFVVMLFGCAPVYEIQANGPSWWTILAFYVVKVSSATAAYGTAFFPLFLLHEGSLPKWRRTAIWFLGGLFFADVVLYALPSTLALIASASIMSHPQPALNALALVGAAMDVFPRVAAPLILVATYFESPVAGRQRLRWIIAGFSLSALLYTGFLLETWDIYTLPYVVYSAMLGASYLAMAIPVAYAILKHHVIDINVAISRATVYTLLSVAIVGTFALIDFFFSRELAQRSAGFVVDIALALILGFSFTSLHRRVDDFVDRILFRSRHIAEEHILGLTEAMPYAKSITHVHGMLVNEPVRTFEFTGAVLVSDLRGTELQTLAAFLESRRKPVRLSDGQWSEGLDVAPWPPVLAVPVFSHAALNAIVFYGRHANMTDLDSDEIALLEGLAVAAGAALDRLEAQALRREIERLRKALA